MTAIRLGSAAVKLAETLKISNVPETYLVKSIPASRDRAPASVYMKYLKAMASFLPVPQTAIKAHEGININSKNRKKATRFVETTVPIIPAP